MKKFLLVAVALLASATSVSAQFTFGSLDFPGSTLTTGRGINNHSQIVGAYRLEPPRHAYLFKAGQFTPLAPSTVLGTNSSEAFKNNDRGDVVGIYQDDIGQHGFLLRKGVVTTLDFPTASDTQALGVNESGTVVGTWDIVDSDGNVLARHGFSWKDDTFSQIDFPGAAATDVYGINAQGDIVGEWDTDIFETTFHGFVLTKGQFFTIDVPFAGATSTQANDISAKGSIVGTWIDADGVTPHGFLAEGAKFTSIDYPGSVGTTEWGINSAGQMVGNWFDSDGNEHGWVATPGKKRKPQ
jgi:uncharacterized membrane protein